MIATSQAPSDSSASDSPVDPDAGELAGRSPHPGGLRPARPVLTYLWLDLYRSLREPANLFFVIAFPLAMYLVFGRLNASAGDYGPHAHGNVSASVMLAMASFSACLGATSASAAAAVEQSAGWGRQMAITGQGQASKEQVAGMLQRMLHLDEKDMPDFMDATDALAAAYCHFLQMGRPETGARHYNGWKDFVVKNKQVVSKASQPMVKTTRTHKIP